MGQEGHGATGDPGTARSELPAVTRRTLLSGAAAVGAATLVAPGMARAAPLGRAASVSSRWLGELTGSSGAIAAARTFALVGLEWAAPAHAHIELRTQAPDGRWSPWVDAAIVGHDGDGQPAGGQRFGEPVWTGAADRVEVRSAGPVHGVRLHFVSASPVLTASAAAFPLAQPRLSAGPGQPPIIARSAWAGGQAKPTHVPEYGTVKLAFVHHTVNPNGYSAAQVPAMLRAIFDYHVYVRSFWDIAYNFIIDAYGRIWEARAGGVDLPVIGAQAGGYNAESTGVAMLGDFMNVLPSPAAIRALEQLLAWKLSLHGIPSAGRVTVVVAPSGAQYTPFAPGAHVTLPRVAGHRDGDSTDCPGNALYDDLPAIRPRITALAGTPARLTITGRSGASAPGTPVTLSGVLQSLSGAPLAGAPIELQQLGAAGRPARTIATTTTGSDGSWSLTLAPRRNAILRALHRPHPASVSDLVELAVAPVITLQLQSASPLVVSGTITPGKRYVTLDLYRGSRPHGRPLAATRARVSQGRFRTRLPGRGRGTFTVVARSAPDAATVAGASAPLTVSVP